LGRLLQHCCCSQCYDHGYWVPYSNMKFWRNLLLWDCSRTITWACSCKSSVNHVYLAPPLWKSCNQVIGALWLWQSATWAEDMYIYTCMFLREGPVRWGGVHLHYLLQLLLVVDCDQLVKTS
jgi:hypothetical protein